MSVAEGFEEFVTIVECGSVTAAATELGLPRPTLSRRLARLEQRLDVRLIHRTTRRMTLTEHGARLFEKARRVVETAREAEAEVRRADGVPRGLLRFSVPTQVPQRELARWLTEFQDLFPEVSLEVIASAIHMDLVEQGIDVALRAGPNEHGSLIAKTIRRTRRIAVATPGYLTQYGEPTDPADLAEHNCIRGFRSGSIPETHWPLLIDGSVAVSGTLATNQMGVRVEAAKRGKGIALVIDNAVTEELAAGVLVEVLPGTVGRNERVCLVYIDREYVDPKVRAFVDFMSQQLGYRVSESV
jgi:DNA-binding transcriptional LysR family regulator